MAERYCIVTGGAGYVGSHFCKALAETTDLTPVTIDTLVRGHEDLIKWGPFVRADVRDPDALDRAFERFAPEAVFHFAGLTYVGESVERPDEYWDVNFVGARCVVRAMLRHECRAIVFSSTAAVYGEPSVDLIGEDQPKAPINPYGRSKLAVEWLLEDFARAHGISSASLRYFNACGADPDLQTGERHDPETHLIPLIIQAALGAREGISIFGTDWPTPDGTAVRDYIHVMDLATAHIAAMREITRTPGARAIKLNLGTGSGTSVREAIDAVRAVSGASFEVYTAPRRAGDPPRLVADSARARELLKWTPTHSSIDEIIRTAYAWHERELKKTTKSLTNSD